MRARNSKIIWECGSLMYGSFTTTHAWGQRHQPTGTASKLNSKNKNLLLLLNTTQYYRIYHICTRRVQAMYIRAFYKSGGFKNAFYNNVTCSQFLCKDIYLFEIYCIICLLKKILFGFFLLFIFFLYNFLVSLLNYGISLVWVLMMVMKYPILLITLF